MSSIKSKVTKLDAVKAPIKLRNLFFPLMYFKAFTKEGSDEPRMPDLQIIRAKPSFSEDLTKCSVMLRIKSEEASGTDKLFYEYELAAFGSFEWAGKKPKDEEFLLKSMAVTGANILYSSVRELLVLISSRGPWGKCLLPTVSFIPEDQLEEPELKVSLEKPDASKKKNQTRKKQR